jgi:23S rRNA (uracil1939-C5)-methyltransferase
MPEIDIDAMSFGPYGVGRLDGETVMVPSAAPGDRLSVTIASRRRDFALARIERVISPGPARRPPPCPYLPRCGGCDWQQIDYAAQLRIKGELIARELGRALGAEIDQRGLVEPAPAEFGYRSRIRLKVSTRGALGFFELGSNRIVEIEQCLVADPEMRMPHTLARALAPVVDEIEVVRSGTRDVLVAHLKRAPGRKEVERARKVFDDESGVAGIVLRADGRREVLGDAEIEFEAEPGLALKVDADLFSQVNRAQNLKLVAAVMEMAAVRTDSVLLDLFCGAGNFSLPAARRGARVTGVDEDAPAIEAARRNAARCNLVRAEFVALEARAVAGFLVRARYRPDAVILDPPRSGARDLMVPIAQLRPPGVVYVACDLNTLARDLKLLARNGYALSRARAFDFFPQTHHVEVAAHAVLT